MRPIDADELLKEINDVYNGYMMSEQFAPEDFAEMVEETKTVEAAPAEKWIPVTERLPEEDTNVLVTMVKGRHKVMYAKYDRQLQKFCIGNYIRSKYVTAWMPLPEPYKEDKE